MCHLVRCQLDVGCHITAHEREWDGRPGRIEQVFVARPTGVERADAITIRIPIEWADYNLKAIGA